MNPKIKQKLQYAFFIGLGFILVWLSIKNVPEDQIQKTKNSFEVADYWIVFLSMIISILAHLVRATRWNLLLKPIGHPVKLWNSFSAVMIGYVVNYALPRVGEISRCGVVSKYDKVPFSTAVGTVVLERILDLICLLVVFILTLAFQFKELKILTDEHLVVPLKNLMNKASSNQPVFILTLFIVFLLILLFLFLRKRIIKFFGSKIGGIFNNMMQGVNSFKKLEKPVSFIFQSLLIWILYFFGLYVSMFCLPETAKLSPEVSLSVLLFSTFGVIVSPGGIGAYQLISTAVLLYYGVEESIAYAFPWIAWLSQLVSILIIGLICFITLPIFNKQHNDEKQSHNG